MTFKSKRMIVNMVAGVAAGAAYIVYALGKNAPAPGDVSAWAGAMLAFVGISIAAIMVIQILFHIAYSIGVSVKEHGQSDQDIERMIESEVTEDELDELVELKASRVGYTCIGIGFMAALAWLAFWGASAVDALHIMLGACFAGAWLEGLVSVRFYERGL